MEWCNADCNSIYYKQMLNYENLLQNAIPQKISSIQAISAIH